MILDTLFATNKTYHVTFSVMESAEVSGQQQDPVETDILTCKCLFVRGASGMKYVSDRMKPDVSATLMIRSADYIAIVPDGAKATVSDAAGNVIGVFSVIYPDNVGGQDEAIVIPCKAYT